MPRRELGRERATTRAFLRYGAEPQPLILAWLVLATCIACTFGAARISTVHTDPTLFVHNARGYAAEAEIRCYLRYLDEEDCFVLESEPGEQPVVRNVLVWPPGTTPWWRDGQVGGVEVSDTGVIQLGEWITGGGGYASPGADMGFELPTVSPDCLTGGGEFAVVHNISAVGPDPG